MPGKILSRILAGVKTPPTSQPSGRIPGAQAPGPYTTADYDSQPRPQNTGPEPASQAAATIEETMKNVADATFGRRGFVAPQDK